VKILAMAVVFSMLIGSLFAQSGSATITGTVSDPTGKVVPDAPVTVRSESGNLTREIKTGEDGRFTVTGVPAGKYTIEVAVPGFAEALQTGVDVAGGGTADVSVPLSVASVNQTVTVDAVVSVAAQLAPSGNTLDATSAKTEISNEYIRNFISPIADFAEVVEMAPGAFSINPNGVGLGQGKSFFRGFADPKYSMSFDGIPFEDTNDGSHHSWSFFPGEWLGATDFDRSPGTASTLGPDNFGGSINLLSRDLQASPDIRLSASYGSFNTRLLDLQLDSGQFGGKEQKSSLFIDLHQLLSDGYETYNYQKQIGGSLKYQYKLSDKTTLTAFTGILDVWNNTPNNPPLRNQIQQFGDNYLNSNDPTSPFFFGYNFYHIQTDFEYIGLHTDLGGGWKFDNKVYSYRYWNKQNYNNSATSIVGAVGVDKLNGYRHNGEIATLSQESHFGILRVGAWYEWAYTDRYQTPATLTWVDNILPNFHEHFITQTFHPFAEYEWRATSRLSINIGVKDAHYNMALDQYADNGGKVGCLGGKLVGGKAGVCVGGPAFVHHVADYGTWLPAASARYRLLRNWSVYGQFAEGSQIPPSSVFDVTGAVVETVPKPTLSKTYQGGSVVKFNRWTLDVDAYYIHFQNSYAEVNDPADFGAAIYYPSGPSNSKGIEAESNVVIARGVSVYLNGTFGKATYGQTGLWVANTPKDTETVGITWQQKNWDVGFFNKRVGSMYNDNGSVNQAVAINPFSVANLSVNYTIKNNSFLRGSKLGFSVSNLFDNHNIVGIVPGTAATASVPFVAGPNDQLTLLPGRAIMGTLTVGYAPKR
jgi:iron complex outermembrane receptor protein